MSQDMCKSVTEYNELYQEMVELCDEDDSGEEQFIKSIKQSNFSYFPPLSRSKRNGPYSHYGKDKVKKLFEYYFVDKLTVKEACTVLGIKERTAYKYIRRLKLMNLPNIFNKRAGYSREKQLKGLADQLAAINLK